MGETSSSSAAILSGWGPFRLMRRIVKGMLLSAWILGLGYLALLSWSQQVDEVLERIRARLVPTTHDQYAADVADLPVEELHKFLLQYPLNQPPVASVLGSLFENRDVFWTDREVYLERLSGGRSLGNREDQAKKELHGEYLLLFEQVAESLFVIAENRNQDPSEATVRREIVPQLFRSTAEVGTDEDPVALPDEAQLWVVGQRRYMDRILKRDRMVNTFLLLVVLGAFGSLIFLIRDYIAHELTTTIAAYVFRPILGMFLAMAMFVVDLLLHSVLSTSEITEVRQEPLFVLAFAAGLLSEQAYQVVKMRAERALRTSREPATEPAP